MNAEDCDAVSTGKGPFSRPMFEPLQTHEISGFATLDAWDIEAAVALYFEWRPKPGLEDWATPRREVDVHAAKYLDMLDRVRGAIAVHVLTQFDGKLLPVDFMNWAIAKDLKYPEGGGFPDELKQIILNESPTALAAQIGHLKSCLAEKTDECERLKVEMAGWNGPQLPRVQAALTALAIAKCKWEDSEGGARKDRTGLVLRAVEEEMTISEDTLRLYLRNGLAALQVYKDRQAEKMPAKRKPA